MTLNERSKCLNVYFTFIFASISATAFLIEEGPHVVHTRYGTIQGTSDTVNFDSRTYQVLKFLGIPYAEPPVGDLRLRKPVPISTFNKPSFDANSFGPACPLPEHKTNIPESEDCLTLNIFSPSSTDGSRLRDLPVMVWIHGGGFIRGTSRIYDGSFLSAYTGVIVVTMNYRLGPLGFFSFEKDVAPGNYGLWDQQLAIKWVRDNIVNFGGNRENITIFGESAGASSVIYQLAYPGNDGLFKRAIAESGTVNTWAMGIKGEISRGAKDFAGRLGCNQSSEGDILTCMRAVSTDVMTKAAQDHLVEVPYDELNPFWVPVYDNSFVPSDTLTLIESMANSPDQFPAFSNTDLMIGSNNYDGGLYFYMYRMLFNASSILGLQVTPDEFEDICAPRLSEMFFKSPVTPQAVHAVLNFYSSWNDSKNGTRRLDELARMTTDATVTVPTVLTTAAHAGGNAKTYMYEFAASPAYRLSNLPVPTVLDGPYTANHADEIAFVFGANEKIQGTTAAQMNLTKAAMTMWSNFAKTG